MCYSIVPVINRNCNDNIKSNVVYIYISGFLSNVLIYNTCVSVIYMESTSSIAFCNLL